MVKLFDNTIMLFMKESYPPFLKLLEKGRSVLRPAKHLALDKCISRIDIYFYILK